VKIVSRVALFLSIFLIVDASVYWLTAHEPTGASLLLIASIAFGYISVITRGAARRAERAAADEELAPLEHAEEEGEENISPTIWPLGFSVATLALVLGVVLARWLLAVGGILFVASAAGWFNDVRRQHQHGAQGSLQHGTDAAKSGGE
jgi:hypothetical protein